MIDVTTETLVLLRDVPRQLPLRPHGKRLHISGVYRWILRGVRGVVLESVRIGGSTYTSQEALQRFSERLTGKPIPPLVNSRQRQLRERHLESTNLAVSHTLGLCRSSTIGVG